SSAAEAPRSSRRAEMRGGRPSSLMRSGTGSQNSSNLFPSGSTTNVVNAHAAPPELGHVRSRLPNYLSIKVMLLPAIRQKVDPVTLPLESNTGTAQSKTNPPNAMSWVVYTVPTPPPCTPPWQKHGLLPSTTLPLGPMPNFLRVLTNVSSSVAHASPPLSITAAATTNENFLMMRLLLMVCSVATFDSVSA